MEQMYLARHGEMAWDFLALFEGIIVPQSPSPGAYQPGSSPNAILLAFYGVTQTVKNVPAKQETWV